MAARARTSWLPRRRWTRVLLAVIALPVFVAAGVAGYYYGRLSLVVQARLAGERVRVIPRVYGRPLTLRVGQTLSDVEGAQRLVHLRRHGMRGFRYNSLHCRQSKTGCKAANEKVFFAAGRSPSPSPPRIPSAP